MLGERVRVLTPAFIFALILSWSLLSRRFMRLFLWGSNRKAVAQLDLIYDERAAIVRRIPFKTSVTTSLGPTLATGPCESVSHIDLEREMCKWVYHIFHMLHRNLATCRHLRRSEASINPRMRPRLDLGCVGGDTRGELGRVSKVAAHMPERLL